MSWTARLGVDPELAFRVVRLSATPRVTPELVRRCLAARLEAALATDAEAILEALEDAVRRRGALATEVATSRAGTALARTGAALLLVGQPGYPARLANAWPELGAPLWIFVRRLREVRLPDAPSVAVIGTRDPTLDGTRTATRLGRLLARHGVVVVSGMARGIDQAAHRGALDADGMTVGVLGTGFAVDYPYGDGALRERVAASGGLVTELLPGVGPKPRHFPCGKTILAVLNPPATTPNPLFDPPSPAPTT
jgi:DNA processing protein